MVTKEASSVRNKKPAAEPTWDVAKLFPDQGTWSPEEYLELNANRLVEFSHGILEVLPMPSQTHQLIVLYLYRLLLNFSETRRLGMTLVAPLPVQLWPGKFREPDVVFMLAANAARRGEQYWEGADLVMEVVSSDDRRRDTETKRREYAQAGIPEYWIVDPQNEQLTVLTLDGDSYAVVGEFAPGETAVSRLLAGFAVEVTAVFAAAQS
jgi:Uma2 family endonuclease